MTNILTAMYTVVPKWCQIFWATMYCI